MDIDLVGSSDRYTSKLLAGPDPGTRISFSTTLTVTRPRLATDVQHRTTTDEREDDIDLMRSKEGVSRASDWRRHVVVVVESWFRKEGVERRIDPSTRLIVVTFRRLHAHRFDGR